MRLIALAKLYRLDDGNNCKIVTIDRKKLW